MESIVSSEPCSLALESEEVVEVSLALLVNKRFIKPDATMFDSTLQDVVELGGTITVSF